MADTFYQIWLFGSKDTWYKHARDHVCIIVEKWICPKRQTFLVSIQILSMVHCFLIVSAYILAENVKKLEKYRWFLSFCPFSVSKVILNEGFVSFWQKNWYLIFPYFSFGLGTFRQGMIQKGFDHFSAIKIQDTVVPKEIMHGEENSKKWFRCIPNNRKYYATALKLAWSFSKPISIKKTWQQPITSLKI